MNGPTPPKDSLFIQRMTELWQQWLETEDTNIRRMLSEEMGRIWMAHAKGEDDVG